MKNETLIEIILGCIATLSVVIPLGMYSYMRIDESNLSAAKEYCSVYQKGRIKKGSNESSNTFLDEVPIGYGNYSKMSCSKVLRKSNENTFDTESLILQQMYNESMY